MQADTVVEIDVMVDASDTGRASAIGLAAQKARSTWEHGIRGAGMSAQTLLIVDDNTFFRRVATRFLTQMDELEVVGAASSAEEALVKAKEIRPQIALVDLNMPQSSGLALIPQLRAMLPSLKIVVLTMWDSEIYRQAALAAGADDFVPKAQINTHLLPALQRLRASGGPFPTAG